MITLYEFDGDAFTPRAVTAPAGDITDWLASWGAQDAGASFRSPQHFAHFYRLPAETWGDGLNGAQGVGVIQNGTARSVVLLRRLTDARRLEDLFMGIDLGALGLGTTLAEGVSRGRA